MRSFDIDVCANRGSWIIRMDGRIRSGAATRATAEKIARHAAESLCRSGYEVRLSVADPSCGIDLHEVLAADVRTAA